MNFSELFFRSKKAVIIRQKKLTIRTPRQNKGILIGGSRNIGIVFLTAGTSQQI